MPSTFQNDDFEKYEGDTPAGGTSIDLFLELKPLFCYYLYMTPEERALLQNIAKNVEENNEMLHAIRRAQKWATVWRAIYWIVIVGSAVGAYWIIQPYIDQLLGVYSGAQSNLDTVKGFLDSYNQ